MTLCMHRTYYMVYGSHWYGQNRGFKCALNCFKLSRFIPLSNACFLRILRTIGNRFSIQFRSGLRGGSLIKVLLARRISDLAILEFCEGSPSWIHRRLIPLSVFINKRVKVILMKVAKKCPHILSYGTQQITPLSCEIATIKFHFSRGAFFPTLRIQSPSPLISSSISVRLQL